MDFLLLPDLALKRIFTKVPNWNPIYFRDRTLFFFLIRCRAFQRLPSRFFHQKQHTSTGSSLELFFSPLLHFFRTCTLPLCIIACAIPHSPDSNGPPWTSLDSIAKVGDVKPREECLPCPLRRSRRMRMDA